MTTGQVKSHDFPGAASSDRQGDRVMEPSPAGPPEMSPDAGLKNQLIQRYLEKPSLPGVFVRARKAWRDAIRNNRW